MALTDDDRARIALGHAMERLVASPEWKQFVSWVEANPGQAAYQRSTARAMSVDECIQCEYEKGTLKGIELTLVAPSNIISEMQKILADVSNSDEDRDEYRNRTVDYDDHGAEQRGGDAP